MAKDQWFELDPSNIDEAGNGSIVHDEEGNEMFSLPWQTNFSEVEVIKAIADRAYRIGRDVGRNEKINEMRRVLEIPVGELAVE